MFRHVVAMSLVALCLFLQFGGGASMRKKASSDLKTRLLTVIAQYGQQEVPCKPLEDQGVDGFEDCSQLTGGQAANAYVALNADNQLVVVKSDKGSGTDWIRESDAMQDLTNHGYEHMPRYDGIVNSQWVTMEFMRDPPWVTLGDFLGVKLGKKTWIKTRALEYPVALRRFKSIVRAVKELHGNGWHHCDLHPWNILVHRTDPDQVKLIDFAESEPLSKHDAHRCARWNDAQRLSTLLPVLVVDADPIASENVALLRNVDSAYANAQQNSIDPDVLKEAREAIVHWLDVLKEATNLFRISRADFITWSDPLVCSECTGHEAELGSLDAALPASVKGLKTDGLAEDPEIVNRLFELLRV